MAIELMANEVLCDAFFLFVHLFWLGVKVDKIEHVPLKYLNVQIGWLASIFYHIHSI